MRGGVYGGGGVRAGARASGVRGVEGVIMACASAGTRVGGVHGVGSDVGARVGMVACVVHVVCT
jgi:hypothetical protein